MSKQKLLAGAVLVAVALAGGRVQAEGLSLWPFTQKTSTTKPKITKKPAKPAPSVIDKMTGGVKSSWNSTTKLLTPGKKKTATTTKKPGFSTARKKPAPDKWSLGGVFGTKKAEPPRSVTEWMSQPRLDP